MLPPLLLLATLAAAPSLAPGGDAAYGGCMDGLDPIPVSADRTAVVIHVAATASPAGKITAYSADRAWTDTVSEASANWLNSGNLHTLVVRAPAPIDGIEFAPLHAACVFHAVISAGQKIGESPPGMPVRTLALEVTVPPPTCARPNAPPAVLRAAEPDTPPVARQQAILGVVRIQVVLDEQGTPTATRVWSSPSAILNNSALAAARSSTYSPEIFRCKPVASTYLLSVTYVAQ